MEHPSALRGGRIREARGRNKAHPWSQELTAGNALLSLIIALQPPLLGCHATLLQEGFDVIVPPPPTGWQLPWGTNLFYPPLGCFLFLPIAEGGCVELMCTCAKAFMQYNLIYFHLVKPWLLLLKYNLSLWVFVFLLLQRSRAFIHSQCHSFKHHCMHLRYTFMLVTIAPLCNIFISTVPIFGGFEQLESHSNASGDWRRKSHGPAAMHPPKHRTNSPHYCWAASEFPQESESNRTWTVWNAGDWLNKAVLLLGTGKSISPLPAVLPLSGGTLLFHYWPLSWELAPNQPLAEEQGCS